MMLTTCLNYRYQGQEVWGVDSVEWNGGMDWNGGLEWNSGMERYFDNFNWWSPLYKDHKTTSL